MKFKNGLVFVGVLTVGFWAAFASVAEAGSEAQIRSGRGKAQLCTRCHGRLGMVNAVRAKKWQGSVEAFIIKELTDFRNGTRTNEVMNSMAVGLSDQDITDIAAWYNSISVKP